MSPRPGRVPLPVYRARRSAEAKDRQRQESEIRKRRKEMRDRMRADEIAAREANILETARAFGGDVTEDQLARMGKGFRYTAKKMTGGGRYIVADFNALASG